VTRRSGTQPIIREWNCVINSLMVAFAVVMGYVFANSMSERFLAKEYQPIQTLRAQAFVSTA